MGTDLDHVIKETKNLLELYEYWKECQPHKFSEEAYQKIKDALTFLNSMKG